LVGGKIGGEERIKSWAWERMWRKRKASPGDGTHTNATPRRRIPKCMREE